MEFEKKKLNKNPKYGEKKTHFYFFGFPIQTLRKTRTESVGTDKVTVFLNDRYSTNEL